MRDIINNVLRKQLHRKAQIAQSVEQGTENPCVAGSIPALGILKNLYGALAQSVEHLTFNQVVRGSNPRCLIRKKERHSYEWRFLFSMRYSRLVSF